MTKLNKDTAKEAYFDSVTHSWTFGRMTKDEQIRCNEAVFETRENYIKGNYGQRINTYALIYSAFLLGLGYDGPFWREKD